MAEEFLRNIPQDTTDLHIIDVALKQFHARGWRNSYAWSRCVNAQFGRKPSSKFAFGFLSKSSNSTLEGQLYSIVLSEW